MLLLALATPPAAGGCAHLKHIHLGGAGRNAGLEWARTSFRSSLSPSIQHCWIASDILMVLIPHVAPLPRCSHTHDFYKFRVLALAFEKMVRRFPASLVIKLSTPIGSVTTAAKITNWRTIKIIRFKIINMMVFYSDKVTRFDPVTCQKCIDTQYATHLNSF